MGLALIKTESTFSIESRIVATFNSPVPPNNNLKHYENKIFENENMPSNS